MGYIPWHVNSRRVTTLPCEIDDSFIANFQEIVKVKKMLKIGQYLMKLCLKYYWFLFSGHVIHTQFRLGPDDIHSRNGPYASHTKAGRVHLCRMAGNTV